MVVDEGMAVVAAVVSGGGKDTAEEKDGDEVEMEEDELMEGTVGVEGDSQTVVAVVVVEYYLLVAAVVV